MTVGHRPARSPDSEPAPLDRFGAGEAAAIALSRSLGATLLVNDHRPAEVARNLGLAVVSCPGMIVVVRSRQLIAAHMAQAMLRVCAQHGTSPGIIVNFRGIDVAPTELGARRWWTEADSNR